ncbi:calcium dependent mitochondrial carrier protein-like protein [Karstenula rhodostoma CBS 690.94]|uniref:Mitochondrial thiamine pyrophosphate carrier 1 n=1 Tax=Karstenula rhodostoma CBS 690.94 TaxID=1392251 RepID=A0A9P4PNY9_9PLEO|nr:calcium dependent mitochondrial carrier protein-like protein [Karstenula rhodostoma CBS 690.94]
MDTEMANAQDARVDALWATLDTRNQGHLDLAALKKGLRKLDHPLKNADQILADVMKSVDTNGDGRISYNEFRTFVHETERELLALFKSIDIDRNGKISRQELQVALSRAGLAVPNSKLDVFFSEVDANNDGAISFEEWRDFLLFMPATAPNLHHVMSYYQGTHHVNPEGDVLLSDDTIYGLEYFVAGGIAGIVSRTSTAPLDRLKVYLIAQTSVTKEAVDAAKSGNVVRAFKNAWHPLAGATKELWQAGGMRSLYAGNGLNVVKVMPESAIKFGAYEAAKRAFATLEGHNDPAIIHSWSKFVAGGMAGMVSQLTIYPIDTLKFRMQCETVSGGLHGNRLIIATALKMWRQGGVAAYYRGVGMGLVGIFPYAALDLGTFEYLKRAITSHNARKRGCHEEDAAPGGFMTAAIGGFSGAFGASMVYPINLLRTRLQSQGTVLHPRTYTGIVDVTQQTIKGEGMRGLFKGLTPNLLKVVPAVSITYVVYDKSKAALGLH